MVVCVCVFNGVGVKGHLTLEQESEESPTTIKGVVSGLAAGKHGIAVHVFGDLRLGADSTDGHFNPYGKNHGAPQDDERHVGSLGNVHAKPDGTSEVHIEDKLVKLIGPYSIIGRSIVICANEDDLGRGGNPSSLANGGVGRALAWGVVGVSQKRS